MTISKLFKRKTVFSFEIFPPKRTSPIETVYKTLDGLRDLRPDFISVTSGAGGSENRERTFPIVRSVQEDYGIPGVAHLPCIGLTRAEAGNMLDELRALGVENLLALRGDIPEGFDGPGEFRYACELVEFIRERGGFDIAAACYPEGHIECLSQEEDLRHLKEKVDAGVSHLITQLFFDNGLFYDFMDQAGRIGIDVPVEAGIMPVTSKRQIERMVSLCGASIPRKLAAMMHKYADDPVALRDAGIDYAVGPIVDLIGQDAAGIHLYTMNDPETVRRICGAVRDLFPRHPADPGQTGKIGI